MSLARAEGSMGDPYEHALRATVTVTLHDLGRSRAVPFDVDRFLAEADETERALARAASGPVLDVGCGPGRMLRAALDAGHSALGVDVSPTAVSIARSRGLPVLQRSVFDPLPAEREWGSVLLLDGNLGIGGDPGALLRRCAALLRPRGRVVAETHPDARRDHRFLGHLRDDRGARGASFPWAEVGRHALRRYAHAAGLEPVREWRSGSRRFAEYARPQ